jgi:hypothetical protein
MKYLSCVVILLCVRAISRISLWSFFFMIQPSNEVTHAPSLWLNENRYNVSNNEFNISIDLFLLLLYTDSRPFERAPIGEGISSERHRDKEVSGKLPAIADGNWTF